MTTPTGSGDGWVSVAADMTAGDRDRLARVALSRLLEPGRRGLGGELARFGAPAVVDAVTGLSPPGSGPLSARVRGVLRGRLAGADPWARAAVDLDRATRFGARLLVPGDAEWPAAALGELDPLADAENVDIAAPLCLWVRGPLRLDEVPARSVAVVGARAVSPYGAHVALELGYGLAERGWGVVSGAALGVDGSAHRGALGGDGVTVAVLGCGVDVPYPLAHESLLERIAEEGLVVSELPPGEGPQRRRFLSRNRLVAALAVGLVVVEAGDRSGTSVTAERAHQLGRVLMAVPGPVTSAQSVGTHRLIRDCGAVLVTSAAEVIEEVGPIGAGLTDPGPVGAGRADVGPVRSGPTVLRNAGAASSDAGLFVPGSSDDATEDFGSADPGPPGPGSAGGATAGTASSSAGPSSAEPSGRGSPVPGSAGVWSAAAGTPGVRSLGAGPAVGDSAGPAGGRAVSSRAVGGRAAGGGEAGHPDRLDRGSLSPELLLVLEAVPAVRPAAIDAVAVAARVSPSQVRRALPALEARGFVEPAGPGYRLTPAARRAPG